MNAIKVIPWTARVITRGQKRLKIDFIIHYLGDGYYPKAGNAGARMVIVLSSLQIHIPKFLKT